MHGSARSSDHDPTIKRHWSDCDDEPDLAPAADRGVLTSSPLMNHAPWPAGADGDRRLGASASWHPCRAATLAPAGVNGVRETIAEQRDARRGAYPETVAAARYATSWSRAQTIASALVCT